MKRVKNLFDNFLKEKIDNQISIIDKLCDELNIDPTEWFESFIENVSCYSGTEFLHDFFSNFMFYLSNEIQKELLKFIKPDGYNINKEPYIHNNIDLSSAYKIIGGDIKFKLKKEDREDFDKLLNKLTIDQKCELMESKIFSYFAQKLNFFSSKEIRLFKLRKIKSI